MIAMPMVLVPVEIKPDEYNGGSVPPVSPNNWSVGDDSMNNNNYATHDELKLSEQKLNSKIEVSNEKASGKINVLDVKVDSLGDKVNGINSKLNWVITLIIGSMLVPIFIKLFVK